MENVICVSTKDVASAEQLCNALYQSVQDALHPAMPRRAKEWLCQSMMIDLCIMPSNQSHARLAEGYWRMLMLYVLEDLAERPGARLIFCDLSQMLNNIKFARGRCEALAVCNALLCAERLYPETYVSAY
jgi:hypothetical protein